jgi:hypothetical protein
MEKPTRRELAVIAAASLTSLTSSLVVTKLMAQTAPSTADADLYKAALESNRQDSDVLAQFEIPMSTEPAFQFKA